MFERSGLQHVLSVWSLHCILWLLCHFFFCHCIQIHKLWGNSVMQLLVYAAHFAGSVLWEAVEVLCFFLRSFQTQKKAQNKRTRKKNSGPFCFSFLFSLAFLWHLFLAASVTFDVFCFLRPLLRLLLLSSQKSIFLFCVRCTVYPLLSKSFPTITPELRESLGEGMP